MELQIKDFVDANLGLVDHDTQAAITATFANIVMTSSDPTIFTVDSDVDTDGTMDVVGVAVGTATLTVSADVSYNDSKTGLDVTANKTVDVPVTITASPESADLVVTFSAPKPVPATP